MPIQVLMPALSPTMTEGKLAKWAKKEGDKVASGDVIAEIETDKATMEVEAVDEGTLGKILVAEGTEGVAVNAPIALLLEEGEDASALDAAAAAPPPKPGSRPSRARRAGAAHRAARPPRRPERRSTGAAPGRHRHRTAEGGGRPHLRQPACPAHRQGGGPRPRPDPGQRPARPHRQGRRREGQVGAAARGRSRKRRRPAEPAAAPKAAAPAEGGPPYVEVPNSGMRKVIAKRLTQSKRDAPHFYLTIDCDIDALMAMREQLNSRSPEGDGAYKISVNDFVTRAVALALRAYPDANCSWTEEAIRYYQTVDVSIAVSTPNGLLTPVIKNADQKGLAAISNEVKQLARRARDGKLKPEEYQGGGFTISNLGMYGIHDFAAVINPPQACLLAVGAAEKRPVVKDNALAIATMMSCTLSIDHRAVDGAKGAEYLQVFKKLIEDPLRMML